MLSVKILRLRQCQRFKPNVDRVQLLCLTTSVSQPPNTKDTHLAELSLLVYTELLVERVMLNVYVVTTVQLVDRVNEQVFV